MLDSKPSVSGELNSSTCISLAIFENLQMLQWVHDQGCEWDEDTCLIVHS
jgi:hypothetical protein